MNSGTIFWVHAAPPCGTASRARLIQRKGQNNPPVVRTDEHPDGLPNLTCSLRDRVESANILYLRTAELFERTWNLGVHMSVENPGRSFMWDTTFWKQRLQQFPVFETLFHHCCHGGHRRKLTKLVHTVPAFEELTAFCPGESEQHKHLPWGYNPVLKQWTTAEETAYPSKLCQTWAALTLVAATDLHVATPAGSLDDFTRTDHRAARASLGMQAAVQKIPPLVREFKDIVILQGPADLMPASKLQATWTIPRAIRCDKDYSMLPAGSRVIRTQFQGVMEAVRNDKHHFHGLPNATSAEEDNVAVVETDIGQAKYIIGVPWMPQEFSSKACSVSHPRHLLSGVPDELKSCILQLPLMSDSSLGAFRTEQIRKWVLRARELRERERGVKNEIPEHCKKVLTKKRLLLFEEMLNETGHGDGTLVKDLQQGFKLTGPIPSVPGFRKKLTPATLTEDDLRRNASRMRKATLMSTRGSGDKELDAAVMEATSKELEKGWLTGPFSETYLEPHACVSRRFGIKQKNKCRPIDNLRESNINSTKTQSPFTRQMSSEQESVFAHAG